MSDLDTQAQVACVPYAVNTECCPEFEDYDDDLKLRAQALAWSSLRALTGGRVGACPVELRPCVSTERCSDCVDQAWVYSPAGGNGYWDRHRHWATGKCKCGSDFDLEMPGTVASILSVDIDGTEMDLADLRVVNGRTLVRVDGNRWPTSQDLALPSGQAGTFTIKYVPGILPGPDGLWAAGVLACEFAKACNGAKCRLPTSATTVARQGVSFEMPSAMFDNGTGIREVDAYLYAVNPNNLKVPPRVWSPDSPGSNHRFTTWGS